MVLQVSYAITASARQAVEEGTPGKASPRKRPRTDDEGTEAAQPAQNASKLFVEQPSPIALAKAIKNKVCTHNRHKPYPTCNPSCILRPTLKHTKASPTWRTPKGSMHSLTSIP